MKQAKPTKNHFYLWWFDQTTHKRIRAGVAFYEPHFGEYRLKVDFLQALKGEKTSHFFLRPIGHLEDRMHFRAEIEIAGPKQKRKRLPVGDGYLSNRTNGEVFIDFGPFEKRLVLTLD